jgi:23S rRNA (adenine2503-C2)-methyltransferase
METLVTTPTTLDPNNDPDLAPKPIRMLPRANRPQGLYDLSFDELSAKLAEAGFPAFRARQLWHWVYQQLAADYDSMTNLPGEMRAWLNEHLPLATMPVVRDSATDDGETHKLLYQTGDGQFVETVLMLYPDRATVCVSCQIGCAVSCAFCATGLGGLTRNLSAGEMVQQTIDAARRAREVGRTLTNLVMMGMGEPLQNYAPSLTFLKRLNDPSGFGFGARRMTVSTSGIVPRIDALADEPLQLNLAVSLHAPNDELRSSLVPINNRYPIAELMAACDRYIAKTGRRVSFEYALMRGINDSDEVATELAALLKGRLCHVNIIPLNPVDVLPYERPDPAGIDRFANTLIAAGIPATVRYSRGLEIDAACGQLRAKHEQETRTG